MKVLKKLNDDRFKIVVALWEGKTFLYLKDEREGSESLGVIEGGEVKRVDELWKRHLKDPEFCLPCELLLIPKLKVLKWKSSVAEIGLTLERLERFREEVGE